MWPSLGGHLCIWDEEAQRLFNFSDSSGPHSQSSYVSGTRHGASHKAECVQSGWWGFGARAKEYMQSEHMWIPACLSTVGALPFPVSKIWRTEVAAECHAVRWRPSPHPFPAWGPTGRICLVRLSLGIKGCNSWCHFLQFQVSFCFFNIWIKCKEDLIQLKGFIMANFSGSSGLSIVSVVHSELCANGM